MKKNSIILCFLVLIFGMKCVSTAQEPEVSVDEEVDENIIEEPDYDLPDLQLIDGVLFNDIFFVKEAVEKGADINARDEFGQTALHIAQDVEIVDFLIESGADVNAVDTDFAMTPIFSKDIEIAKLLVDAGADINVKNNEGNTPLLWYAYSGYTEGVEYLVSKGADPDARNILGDNALDVAVNLDFTELADYLRSIGLKETAMEGIEEEFADYEEYEEEFDVTDEEEEPLYEEEVVKE